MTGAIHARPARGPRPVDASAADAERIADARLDAVAADVALYRAKQAGRGRVMIG